MIAPLIGCAFLNAGVDMASATEYQVAEAIGLGPATCGAVALGADIRTLWDLDRVFGPAAAVWVPFGVTAGTHVAAWMTSTPSLPTFASVLMSGIVWLTCRKGNPLCSAFGS